MKGPTVTQAYAMIRFLKARAAKGDAAKIEELKKIVNDAKLKEAQLDVEKFFPS